MIICSYYVERGVCYLALCEKSFSKRQVFAYLEELQTEFAMQYGQKFGTVSRPYSFIEFGKCALTQSVHEQISTRGCDLRMAFMSVRQKE